MFWCHLITLIVCSQRTQQYFSLFSFIFPQKIDLKIITSNIQIIKTIIVIISPFLMQARDPSPLSNSYTGICCTTCGTWRRVDWATGRDSPATGLLLPTHLCVLVQEGHWSGASGPRATVSADMLAACGGNTWNSADPIGSSLITQNWCFKFLL